MSRFNYFIIIILFYNLCAQVQNHMKFFRDQRDFLKLGKKLNCIFWTPSA